MTYFREKKYIKVMILETELDWLVQLEIKLSISLIKTIKLVI